MTSLLFDPRQIRSRTCDALSQLGIAVRGDQLPQIFAPGADVEVRTLRDIEARGAILNIVQARVFDMPPHMAMRWLLDAHVLEDLTADEWQFIATGRGDPQRFSEQLESLYTIAWMLGLVAGLDPARYCSDNLPSLMPDLRSAEPFERWRARTLPSCRDAVEVAEALDLYGCLDWLCVQSRQHGMVVPGNLDESVVWHRRWALRWLVVAPGQDRGYWTPWDDIR